MLGRPDRLNGHLHLAQIGARSEDLDEIDHCGADMQRAVWLDEEQPPAMLHRAAPWGPVPISGMPESGARAMVPRPAKIAIQYRTWDFARDLDAPHYCDAMTVVALDVEGGAVSEAAGLPCDFIDWDAPAGRNMGTV